ncbi:MAG: DNA-binding transcriptional regulator Fis [Gammaproteobacteria bacterium]
METTTVTTQSALAEESKNTPLGVLIQNALKKYLDNIGDAKLTDLYKMVRDEMDEAILRVVMAHTKGNQSKAAIMLGMSRTTLRKKLKLFDML